MKYSKFLAGAIAAVAMLAVSCEREAGPTGEDPSRPVPTEIIYDVENATNDNLAIRWNAAPCIAAGAQSFTIQTCSDVEKGTSSYSTSASKVVMASEITDGIGRYQFAEKSRYGSSYVRIRANYKKSAFSSWAWASTHDTPCLVETGFGMTDYTIAHPAISFKAAGTDDMTVLYDATNCSGADTIRINLVDYNSRKILDDVRFTTGAAGEQKFEGLKEGKLYQVRIRQEYKGTAYPYVSDWECAKGTALNEDGEEVESSVYQFGKGWVVVNGVAPTPRLKVAYSGMVVVEWSENGFSDKAADAGLKVNVALWEDEACTKLHNGFRITSDIFNGQQACMSFANLEPGTSYWVTCQDQESNLTSDPLKVQTAAFDIVRVTGTKVAAGDNALAENFGELFFGGNAADVAPGVSNSTGLTTVYPTVGEWSSDAYADNNNHGFFNTLGNNGKVQNSRFNDWAVIHGKKDGTGDEVLGDVCVRIASFQMGASSGVPIVFTPELTNLESMATVQLSIVVSTMAEKGAAKENSASDFQKIGIYTANGGSRNSSKSTSYAKLTDATVRQVAELDRPKGLDADGKAYFGWESKSVILRNIAPGTRIGIGAIRPDGKTGNQRFLLREVVVKVLSYGAPTLTPPVLVSSEVHDVDFTVTFDKQEFAQTYSIAYQKCGDSTWNETTGLTEPTLTVTGLTEETEYHVRCRAVAGDFYEETILVIKTKEPEIITMGTPVVSVEPGAAAAEVNWAAVEKATNYEVYIKKAADADWTKAGETAETSFTVTGLDSNTDYVAGVKATYKTNASEIGEKAFKTLDYTAPSEIGTAEDFIQWLALGAPAADASATLTLTADIDLTGKTLPEVEAYAGTLNGNGKSIKNWATSAPLFNSLTGTVKDLTIDASCTITAPTEGIFGLIAGTSSGTISGCTNKASINLEKDFTAKLIFGSIVGRSTGKVVNCTNTGNILIKNSATYNYSTIGGVVGQYECIAGAFAVESCNNTGNITIDVTGTPKITYLGGVVGGTPSHKPGTDMSTVKSICPNVGTVKSCRNTGAVTQKWTVSNSGSYCNMGGVAGYLEGSIENCTNEGAVTLDSPSDPAATSTRPSVGGVAGYVMYSAKSCTNSGKFTANGAYAAGTNGNEGTGGMFQPSVGAVFGGIGWGYQVVSTGEIMEDCHNTGEISTNLCQKSGGSTKGNVGCVAGYCSTAIKGCSNTGKADMKVAFNASYVGGIAGCYYGSSITNSFNAAEITLNGRSTELSANTTNKLSAQVYFAGVAGYVFKGTVIDNCENKSPLKMQDFINEAALSYLGGINGSYTAGITMKNCKNSAAITSESTCSQCVGGLSGAFNGTMTDNRNEGAVSAIYGSAASGKETEVGGLIGYANATINGCTNTGAISTAKAGTYAGGLVGGFGAATVQWSNCTADCTISGDATKGSLIGRIRTSPAAIYYSGTTIGSSLTALDPCGSLNGSTVTEGTMPTE